jgi:hypothetical protein
MSNLTKIQFPRSNITSDQFKTHLIKQGGSRVTQQVFSSNSWGSVGAPIVQASFSINPPSTQTLVDRDIRIKCYLKVETDQPMQVGTNDALRQFPIQSITDVLTVQLNGETLSQNTSDFMNAIMCFNNTVEDRNGAISTSPGMPDQYQAYQDWATYGSGRNPLADYGENSSEMTRGGFPIVLAGDKKSFTCEVVEPLFLSPFLSGQSDEEAFVNINQLNLSFRFVQNTNRVLCHSVLGNAITTVTVSFTQAPEILLNYISPQITMPLPTVQTVSYSKLQQYIKPVTGFVAGSSQVCISDSIKLSMIPSAMYLFVRHARSASNYLVSDSYAKLSNINVLWNNQSGLLATASDQELYSITHRCGSNLSWPQYSKYRGSVFAVEFGEDIGLQANECAGVAGQYTIQVQATATNLSTTGDFEYFVVFDMPGTTSVFENGCRSSIGNYSESMVLAAHQSSEEMSHEVYSSIHGGGRRGGGKFMGRFKNFIHKVSGGIQKAAQFAQPFVDKVAPEYSQLVRGVGSVAGEVSNLSAGSRTSGGRLSRMSRR